MPLDVESLIDKANQKAVTNTKDRYTFNLNGPFVPDAGLKGKVGLEIEVEATNHLPTEGHIRVVGPETNSRWVTHNDGSLRGVAREYVLSTPCSVEELDILCKGLYNTFEAQGSTLDLSNRCSTHVHVNMSNRKINEITSVILLWALFEESIIDWSGEERKTNHFCLAFKDSPQVYQAWRNVLVNGSQRELTARNLKYSALNLMPLLQRGSIEFRCGRADPSADFPIQFATLVSSIVDHAVEEYQDPVLVASHVSEGGAYDIFRRVCERRPAVLLPVCDQIVGNDVHIFNKKAMQGFRRVQELCYAVNWPELLKEIKRPFVPNPFGKKLKQRSIPEAVERFEVQFGPAPPVPNEQLLDAVPLPNGGFRLEPRWRENPNNDRVVIEPNPGRRPNFAQEAAVWEARRMEEMLNQIRRNERGE